MMKNLLYFTLVRPGVYQMKQRLGFAGLVIGGCLLFVLIGLWVSSLLLTLFFGVLSIFALLGYVNRRMEIDLNHKIIRGKRGATGIKYEIPLDKILEWEFYSMSYFGLITVNSSLNLHYLNEAGKEKVETLAIGFRKPFIQKVKNEIDEILKDQP